MTQTRSPRLRKPTLLLIIASTLTLLLAIAVGIAYLARPKPIVLAVSSPRGTIVLCDFVIDGRAESLRDTVPVTYTYMADRFQFAVITESAVGGHIRVDLSTRHGGGSTDAAGVTGEYQGNAWGSRSSIGGMTDKHIASMRAARLVASRPGDTSAGNSSDPESSPADSSVMPHADSAAASE